MAEGSNVNIGFCEPFDLMRTPDSTCVAVWLIVVGKVGEGRQYEEEKRKSSR
ncbi:hypothetical protein K443DRAFT_683355 [Laccaria amethystina LaAM-08-1]|uniref:Unplaced genomic scaffold K443scaffold_236, whole genome shotgun sequence n=1 Tax=Laccaria amethystina LaAM-08-1 TaxID=1095629 RepID=A0A0C9WJN3_9AGAR|nr:hypothetical protein K443DRAFT_683355 [Laccaria amethystina LaAM-08-1]